MKIFTLFLFCFSAFAAPNFVVNKSLDNVEAFGNAFKYRKKCDGVIKKVANTGSMRPYFHGNTYVVIESVEFTKINVNDLIVFRRPNNTLVIHLVAHKKKNGLVTMGAANRKLDSGFVTDRNCVGVVRNVYIWE